MDALEELLYGQEGFQHHGKPPKSGFVSAYTNRLSTLSISALTSTEPEALHHDRQSLLRSLHALAKRSYKSINAAAESVASVKESLPSLSANVAELQTSLPGIEARTASFSEKYAKPTENPLLERRRRAMRLGDNVEKVSNILELPTLLESTIAASATTGVASGTSASSSSSNANYAQALDLYAHIKRLQRLYPESHIIASITAQAEEAMRGMTTRILLSLRSQSLKLAGAMRLIGLLRRVAPELEDSSGGQGAMWASSASEGSLGLLFLISRLFNLNATLEALEPLQALADQESEAREDGRAPTDDWAAGQQTERYLKRYIEVFREQCFAIVSMYKSVFPTSLAGPTAALNDADDILSPLKSPVSSRQPYFPALTVPEDAMQKIPPALSTFAFELVDMLMEVLRSYLPNVRDDGSRDSLLTQVLYCAGSLGRLGGDFGMMLALLQEDLEKHTDSKPIRPNEWIDVTKRHRVQAGRLELLASGVGAAKANPTKGVTSPA